MPAGDPTGAPVWRRAATLVVMAVVVLVVGGTAAYAHVHLVVDGQADPGLSVMLNLEFDHGCDGQPTTGFVVQLPDGVDDVHVEPHGDEGWEVEVDDGVVTWSGGEPVPDRQLHAFRMRVVLPERPGETLHFATIQRCGDDEIAWIQIPGEDEEWDDLDRPAPELTLTDRPPPDRPGEHPLDDETPPPAPEGGDEEPTMEPIATPVGDAEDGGVSPLTVAALALAAALSAGAAVIGWRRARSSSTDPTEAGGS